MKVCPRCGSLVFDDLDTCYGCMYRFKAPALARPDAPMHGAGPGEGADPQVPGGVSVQQQAGGSKGDRPSEAVRVTDGAAGPTALDPLEWARFESQLQHEYERFERSGAGEPGDGSTGPFQVPGTVAFLSCRTRGGEESRYPLQRGRTLHIGRSSRCDVVLSAPSVSRVHASVEVAADGIWLEDLGSSNHTYVQDEAITDRVRLQVGDGFLICGSCLRIEPLGTGDDPMGQEVAPVR